MTRTAIVFCLMLMRAACADEKQIMATLISNAPVIDGVLNDAAWQGPPLDLGEWLTYNPLFGEKMVQRTEVRVAFDASNLYFAFRCFDPEPDKIKTSISRRDTIFNDDWVGMSLDAMGNGQNAYEMMVNPSGVQADLIYGASSGEDSAPDWVWESSGRRTEDGYVVEIRLPFKSIRFKSGERSAHGNHFLPQSQQAWDVLLLATSSSRQVLVSSTRTFGAPRCQTTIDA